MKKKLSIVLATSLAGLTLAGAGIASSIALTSCSSSSETSVSDTVVAEMVTAISGKLTDIQPAANTTVNSSYFNTGDVQKGLVDAAQKAKDAPAGSVKSVAINFTGNVVAGTPVQATIAITFNSGFNVSGLSTTNYSVKDQTVTTVKKYTVSVKGTDSGVTAKPVNTTQAKDMFTAVNAIVTTAITPTTDTISASYFNDAGPIQTSLVKAAQDVLTTIPDSVESVTVTFVGGDTINASAIGKATVVITFKAGTVTLDSASFTQQSGYTVVQGKLALQQVAEQTVTVNAKTTA